MLLEYESQKLHGKLWMGSLTSRDSKIKINLQVFFSCGNFIVKSRKDSQLAQIFRKSKLKSYTKILRSKA